MKYRSLYFTDDKLRLIDQTELPEIKHVELHTQYEVHMAIKQMKVRGAPAIGIAAAYGMALAANHTNKERSPKCWQDFIDDLIIAGELLKAARPTAVNLEWAVERMFRYAKDVAASKEFDPDFLCKQLLYMANLIMEEDQRSCSLIGKFGSVFINDGSRIMTHCNAGALATSELGTALAPIYTAHGLGRSVAVYCCETRPFFQGSRLTAWELMESGIKPTVICDNMAGQVMKNKQIDMVIVGADRIAANGDTANKIGTYSLAVLAKYHNIPFYVAAPYSTFDMNIKCGSSIAIEQRHAYEVTQYKNIQIAPVGVDVYNPAFDVTPAELITSIITDYGIISEVNEDGIKKMWTS